MSEELAVLPTAEIANDVTGIPAMRGQLSEWCQLKLQEARAEEAELRNAHAEAKAHKWKCSTLASAANKALKRVEYYEKVSEALAAGYMLFPPIDNIDVIAIRTQETIHDHQYDVAQRYSTPTGYATTSESPEVGVGEYKDPRVKFQRWGVVKKTLNRADGTTYTEDIPNFRPLLDMTAPVFPLVMAKVKCVEATNAAMEGKFFDDIAIYPARARKDPVILGRIFDPERNRWLNFLISWRIDKRDL